MTTPPSGPTHSPEAGPITLQAVVTVSATNRPSGSLAVAAETPVNFEGWLELIRLLEVALTRGSLAPVAPESEPLPDSALAGGEDA